MNSVVVPLRNSTEVAIVSSEDAEAVLSVAWKLSSEGYVVRCSGDELVRLHRFILSAKQSDIVDHANGDKLDNTRVNLRFATREDNVRNSPCRKNRKNNMQYKGVYKNTRYETYYARGTWMAGGKQHHKHLGSFRSAADAAKAWDAWAREFHGAFARLNFPTEQPELVATSGLEPLTSTL